LYLQEYDGDIQAFQGNFKQGDQQVKQEASNNDGSFNSPEKSLLRKQFQMNFDGSPAPSSPFMMNNFQKGINQHSTLAARRCLKALLRVFKRR